MFGLLLFGEVMRFLMGLRRDRHHHQSCGAFLRCCKMLLVLGSLIAEAGALTERSMVSTNLPGQVKRSAAAPVAAACDYCLGVV